jgi:hypothetical protein
MKKKNKKIKFNMVKYVMLIPSRREFDDNNFRFSALYEIQQIMLRHNDMHIKDAIRLLYQPNNIKFDKNNFITLDNENEYVSNIFLF